MHEIILQEGLKSAVENSTFIKNGVLSSCEGMKYDFRLSHRILRADLKRPLDFVETNVDLQKQLFISPGEVAFVMTEETLDLPDNVFCQLSTKRKLSHDGIIVLGGFIVDPRYHGKLIFGLYNISSKDFTLIPGRKLVAGVFYKLETALVDDSTPIPDQLTDFPDGLVRMIGEYKSKATESLASDINNLKDQINTLREQINTDKAWKDDFKSGLQANNEQIHKLGGALQELTEKLSNEIDERKESVSSLKATNSFLKGIGFVVGGILSGVVLTLFATWVAGILFK